MSSKLVAKISNVREFAVFSRNVQIKSVSAFKLHSSTTVGFILAFGVVIFQQRLHDRLQQIVAFHSNFMVILFARALSRTTSPGRTNQVRTLLLTRVEISFGGLAFGALRLVLGAVFRRGMLSFTFKGVQGPQFGTHLTRASFSVGDSSQADKQKNRQQHLGK
jgi:hypothetical protein